MFNLKNEDWDSCYADASGGILRNIMAFLTGSAIAFSVINAALGVSVNPIAYLEIAVVLWYLALSIITNGKAGRFIGACYYAHKRKKSVTS
jgi:hypothetical protein